MLGRKIFVGKKLNLKCKKKTELELFVVLVLSSGFQVRNETYLTSLLCKWDD